MTKFRPPAPANDHLAAFRMKDDLDSLTDAEIEARLEARLEAARSVFSGFVQVLTTPLLIYPQPITVHEHERHVM